jgi:hypothetical protein
VTAPVEFQKIQYLGGPYDGDETRMSDGVRMKVVGGYYEPSVVKDKRVAMWHAVPEEGL